MATDFIMPRLPDQQPHALYYSQAQNYNFNNFTQPNHYQHAYRVTTPTSSTQISPLSTSNNTSQTSPKTYHGLQRRPLYMPAVLRPTEYLSKQDPHKKKSESEGQDDDDQLKTNVSFISLSGPGALSRLNRRSTGDSGKCMDGEWNLELFPKPTAQPTRKHWKPDTEATICDEPSCLRHFNYWTRRHHCRKCGNIFCDSHSAFDIPLDQDANYNPKGTISRACNHCYSVFKSWRSRTNSQASSDRSSVTNHGPQTAPSSPLVASPSAMSVMSSDYQHPAEVAASVPRDWNWSTF